MYYFDREYSLDACVLQCVRLFSHFFVGSPITLGFNFCSLIWANMLSQNLNGRAPVQTAKMVLIGCLFKVKNWLRSI